jgi:chemotaxis protein methyltransferase CheR
LCLLSYACCVLPSDLMPDKSLEDIEIELLLDGIYQQYGYDFRNYSAALLKRRIWHTMRSEKVGTISGLQEKVLHNPEWMERLLLALSINVTSMFRDPDFYLAFRQKVVPILRTYPFVRIWNAGCSTGEEAYSLAILLAEEGLYDRCHIYATDMNSTVLKRAEAGIFPLSAMQEYAANHAQAGGTACFLDMFTTKSGNAVLKPSLKRNMTFAQHNLVTDSAFNEFNVVLCRNVLIYFNRDLQNRVHELLYESLATFGVLGLGKKETINLTSYQKLYKELDAANRLYRKIA